MSLSLHDIEYIHQALTNTLCFWPDLRGIELQVTGTVKKQHAGSMDGLKLSGNSTRPDLVIKPFKAASKLERDHKAGALMPASDHELRAYDLLLENVSQEPQGVAVKVTGRLHKQGDNQFSLDVKDFDVLDTNAV